MKQVGLVLLCIVLGAQIAQAEPADPPFFWNPVRFSSEFQILPSLGGWIGLHQVLNQKSSIAWGHDLDSGLNLNLFSSPWLAASMQLRELLGFRVHPTSDFLFWPRDLLTDFQVGISVNLSPVVIGINYRHDSKCDIDWSSDRQVVLDRAGLSVTLPPGPRLLLLDNWFMDLGLRASAEWVLPPVIMRFEPEPEQFNTSLEACWTIVGHPTWGRAFVEGRVRLAKYDMDTKVIVQQPWDLDWRVETGIELTGSAGVFRLSWRLDRTADPWTDNSPTGATVSNLCLTFIAVH